MQQSSTLSFKQFSNFASLRDFNNHIEMFLSIHKKDFTTGELCCFKTLLRFSVKCFGISNISITKLLQAVSDKFKTTSEATFHRFKRKAIKLGILKVEPLHRSNGSQSSNLWVWQRFDTPSKEHKVEEEPTHQHLDDNANDTPISKPVTYQTSNINTSRTYSAGQHHDIIPDWLMNKNPRLVSLASNYFTGSQIKELIVSYMSVSKNSKLTSEELVDLSLDTFKQTVYRIKSGKRIDNVYSYFTGTLKKKEKGYRLRQLWDGLF